MIGTLPLTTASAAKMRLELETVYALGTGHPASLAHLTPGAWATMKYRTRILDVEA